MSFISGKNNNFRFHFPKVFVPDAIEEKYTPFLKRIPGCMCENIIDFINYSIKKVDLQVNPETYETIEQVDRGTPFGRLSRSDKYPDGLWKREMTITFQLDSMYLIWFIMCELLMHYYCIKDKYLPKPPGMEILDMYNKVMYRVTFDQLLFTGVDGLDFDFASTELDQKELSTTWIANKVDIVLEPSKV